MPSVAKKSSLKNKNYRDEEPIHIPATIPATETIDAIPMSRTRTMETIPMCQTMDTSFTMDTSRTMETARTKDTSRTMDTLPTTQTMDSSLPTIQSYQPSKITFDHKVTSISNRGLLFGVSKPILVLVAGIILTTSGGAAFFFKEWLRIPGLQSQIVELHSEVYRLENEVSRLSVEISELSAENDRFETLNAELNVSVREYRILNEQLNSTTSRLQNITEQLNMSNQILDAVVDDLSAENELYETLNNALNSTNKELSQLNFELSAVASFLNKTASGMQYTFDGITSFLAEQITMNRGLLLDMIENTYMQRIATWECDFQAYFRGEEFLSNGGDVPMDAVSYKLAMDYIQDRILSVLCLHRSDFELYLDSISADGSQSITFNLLAKTISVYTTGAFDYYFPSLGQPGGLMLEDWEDASYTCENLIVPFTWNWS